MDEQDAQFNIMTSRLLRREALRRAAQELNTTSPIGLEDVMARISAEVTADAAARAHAPDVVDATEATKQSAAHVKAPPRAS
jgi:hypothetical protein